MFSLIDTNSRRTPMSDKAKTMLGDLVVFIIKDVLPTTKKPKIFDLQHPSEKKYLQKFAKQLNVKDEFHHLFTVPAVSLLIN